MQTQQDTELVVRCYIVRALNLCSKGRTVRSSLSIKIDVGRTSINDRSDYIMNHTSPVFGKKFQFNASLPRSFLGVLLKLYLISTVLIT